MVGIHELLASFRGNHQVTQLNCYANSSYCATVAAANQCQPQRDAAFWMKGVTEPPRECCGISLGTSEMLASPVKQPGGAAGAPPTERRDASGTVTHVAGVSEHGNIR